jgi:peptidoglycan-associated lipoprotein
MVELTTHNVTPTRRRLLGLASLLLIAVAVSCAKKPAAPLPQPAPPPPVASASSPVPPSTATTSTQPIDDSVPVPLRGDDAINSRSIEDLNRNSPLKPAFFGLDSAELDDAGRSNVAANAEILKRYPSWMVTIEGHCDERGTAEYNLALGERRAVAVRTYLVALGIAPDRLRSVSYGKEFPFDPGHTDAAWAQNRRAHFVITSK